MIPAMIYSLDELRPGSIVEHDGQLILIEDLRFRLVGQCIASYRDLLDRLVSSGHIGDPPAPAPVFVQLEGSIDDPVWDYVTPYQPKESSQ